jgi:magnesium chelatase family protein
MLGQAWSASLQGVEGIPIRVEAQVATGIPGLFIVGLPRGAVREGRDRIQSALRNLPGASDALRVTINLAPADLMKDGSALDLAMAVALLGGAGLVPASSLAEAAFVGELGLDGRLHPVRGVLPLALGCVQAGLARLVVPEQNLAEAESLAGEIELLGAASLQQVVGFLRGDLPLTRPRPPGPVEGRGPGLSEAGQIRGRAGPGSELGACGGDLASIRGQALGRRALEIAAAGNHSVLFAGPPGAGKTMLARALPGLLPDLDRRSALEVTAIHSVAGLLPVGVGLLTRPPFRAPHHGASQGALVGGGTPLRPGEATLAHRGVLFLDELAHWVAPALDALREPVETGFVDVIRTGQRARFPASFLLVAAMNPCPCGRFGSTDAECTCDPSVVRRYQSRVSGPLLDRVDLRVRLDPPPASLLLRSAPGETSAAVRSRVEAARALGAGQRHRGDRGGEGQGTRARGIHPPPHTRGAGQALEAASVSLRLSARGVVRMLEVARTISCLAGLDVVEEDHVVEALHFRQL